MTHKPSSKLADFFIRQREIIESAETPFAKLAVFVLPILAPLVPAALTGFHLYQLFLKLFTFHYSSQASFILSFTVAVVLEMLGYVGAISFIRSIFDLIKHGRDLYLLPAGLNGMAYIFYLVVMFLINVRLGQYFQVPDIINSIIGLLSFITVPTGLLAANHLSQQEEKEESKELRLERREERLERLRIKSGTTQTFQQVTRKLPTPMESSEKVSTNWRKVSKQLSDELVIFIATHEPRDVVPELSRYDIFISPRTASNWCEYAPREARERGLEID